MTSYVLTDRKVLILSDAFNSRLNEIALDSLPMMQLDGGRSGFGTITFGASGGPWTRLPPGWPTLGMYAPPPAFESIADVGRVYRLIQDAKRTQHAARNDEA